MKVRGNLLDGKPLMVRIHNPIMQAAHDKRMEKEISTRQCTFCSMRATRFCEFPECGQGFCRKHGVTTGTTDLCRDHKKFAELKPAAAGV
jgi:hypothetical protein